jgi:hypothetical protein
MLVGNWLSVNAAAELRRQVIDVGLERHGAVVHAPSPEASARLVQLVDLLGVWHVPLLEVALLAAHAGDVSGAAALPCFRRYVARLQQYSQLPAPKWAHFCAGMEAKLAGSQPPQHGYLTNVVIAAALTAGQPVPIFAMSWALLETPLPSSADLPVHRAFSFLLEPPVPWLEVERQLVRNSSDPPPPRDIVFRSLLARGRQQPLAMAMVLPRLHDMLAGITHFSWDEFARRGHDRLFLFVMRLVEDVVTLLEGLSNRPAVCPLRWCESVMAPYVALLGSCTQHGDEEARPTLVLALRLLQRLVRWGAASPDVIQTVALRLQPLWSPLEAAYRGLPVWPLRQALGTGRVPLSPVVRLKPCTGTSRSCGRHMCRCVAGTQL